MGRKTQTMMPMMGGNGGSGRRIVATLTGLAFVVLMLRDPIGAAHAVQQVWSWCGSVIDALGAFGSALSK